MDEPLAAFGSEAKKAKSLPYLERLHDELEIPMCYVSHVPDEVARLADYVVLLSEGRVVAAGGLRRPWRDSVYPLPLPGMLAWSSRRSWRIMTKPIV